MGGCTTSGVLGEGIRELPSITLHQSWKENTGKLPLGLMLLLVQYPNINQTGTPTYICIGA